jgi:hypothetical protein
MPIQARISTPSTAAIVTCVNPRFENSAGVEDAGFVTMDMQMKFNGVTDELGDKVTFDRNATNAEKQAAVRNRLNAILTTYEVGVTLNNANIQIVGLPV